MHQRTSPYPFQSDYANGAGECAGCRGKACDQQRSERQVHTFVRIRCVSQEFWRRHFVLGQLAASLWYALHMVREEFVLRDGRELLIALPSPVPSCGRLEAASSCRPTLTTRTVRFGVSR